MVCRRWQQVVPRLQHVPLLLGRVYTDSRRQTGKACSPGTGQPRHRTLIEMINVLRVSPRSYPGNLQRRVKYCVLCQWQSGFHASRRAPVYCRLSSAGHATKRNTTVAIAQPNGVSFRYAAIYCAHSVTDVCNSYRSHRLAAVMALG